MLSASVMSWPQDHSPPHCSSVLGNKDSADPLPSGHSWLRSLSLPTHEAVIKYMLIILADAEGRLSAALR